MIWPLNFQLCACQYATKSGIYQFILFESRPEPNQNQFEQTQASS